MNLINLSINKNIQEIQEKLAELRENKARNEATLDGIKNRRDDLFYSINSEMNNEPIGIVGSI